MVISEIECRRGYTCVKVRFKEKSEVGKILGTLAEADIHFTIPKIHENSLNFVLPQSEEKRALEILTDMGYNPQLLSGCSLVIVYAPDMRNLFGIMVQILEAMLKEGAEVLQVGDAYNSVSCLIRDEKLKGAISSLKESFPNTAIKCELS